MYWIPVSRLRRFWRLRRSQRAGARLLFALAIPLLPFSLPSAAALTDVSAWAQEGVSAAWEAGLEPLSLHTASATDSITRAEFCSVALNLYKTLGGTAVRLPSDSPFTDCEETDVRMAHALHLVNGRGGVKEGLFEPDESIQRQDLCIILQNVLEAAKIIAPPIQGEDAIQDYPDIEQLAGYATSAVTAMVDYGVMSGVADAATGDTMLSPTQTTTREQAMIMASRFLTAFEPRNEIDEAIAQAAQSSQEEWEWIEDTEWTEEWDWSNWGASLELYNRFRPSSGGSKDTSYSLSDAARDKMTLVYGPGGTKYQTEEEAESHMVEIAVKVWRLRSDGTKTTGTAYIQVNENLASTYEAIFDEIYNGPERFPIQDVGCFSWRPGEHSQGTAIDINWEENMEARINEDGTLTPTTGDHWTPGLDPFSIPPDGDVVRAFANHGFAWGGNAWRTKRDYMHFSYFGR